MFASVNVLALPDEFGDWGILAEFIGIDFAVSIGTLGFSGLVCESTFRFATAPFRGDPIDTLARSQSAGPFTFRLLIRALAIVQDFNSAFGVLPVACNPAPFLAFTAQFVALRSFLEINR